MTCFSCSAIKYDVGMLRMATAATLSTTVGTICLASHKIEELVRVTATGWGGTDASETQATFLKEVQLVLNS